MASRKKWKFLKQRASWLKFVLTILKYPKIIVKIIPVYFILCFIHVFHYLIVMLLEQALDHKEWLKGLVHFKNGSQVKEMSPLPMMVPPF